jgi:hypothetical protein
MGSVVGCAAKIHARRERRRKNGILEEKYWIMRWNKMNANMKFCL